MFIETPAAPNDYLKRKPIFGVGVNDAPYKIKYTNEAGKSYLCPFYQRWKNMLQRVYYPTTHKERPTYIECSVESTWLHFMNFRAWMKTQNWANKVLDKDLLVQGNKHYGPDTCVFVSQELNTLLTLRGNARGDYPLGVTLKKDNGKAYLYARCSVYGKRISLGFFNTAQEANNAYKKAKLAHIADLAANEPDQKIKAALLRLF